MFNYFKQTLANVAGTQEPEYGPSAIQPVGQRDGDPAFTEVKKEHLKWMTISSASVETQTFYFQTDAGHLGFVQVIYSNVVGLRVTCQFNCKIFYPNNEKPTLWSSDPVDNYGFDENQYCFYADGVSVELSEDGTFYTIKSATNENSLVNLKVTKAAPGFMGGKDGTSNYGTDPKNPWGWMRHAFWPRCKVEGSIITKDGEINCKGRGFYSFALQGMKPHHAAARWNFVNFQSPTYSASIMEFTTPPSYGSTAVRAGGIAVDDKLLLAGTSGMEVKHTQAQQDAETDWPEPTGISCHWEGKTADGKDVSARLSGPLHPRLDRVDVMAEVPGFVKTLVASAVGTKPYIYQFSQKMTIEVKIGEEVKHEEGWLFLEASFVC
ncbi:survival factor 1 [Sporormia fimetaria CBS 119925]|uniref:Survival factor 1 n=1 Tax=Sporormia fimetaria CBS 119925 TaxID=1340428 RepID=A0A6A6V2F3_9PLEO|nr:survival factor 1 [Sporormia fimetaria CBS 119925]